MKVTQWFGPETTPVLCGVYQRRTPGNGRIFYSFWNGVYWGAKYFEPAHANSSVKSRNQFVWWRGIPASL